MVRAQLVHAAEASPTVGADTAPAGGCRLGWPTVLVLLPPSETKRDGGDGPPLALGSLSFPSLDVVRKPLIDELVVLAADVPASRAALGISERQDDEVARNAALWTSPTLPAIRRYTGVLYDALDFASLGPAARARAVERLAVGSALFGLVMAGDPVPAYRLSAGSALPAFPAVLAPPAGPVSAIPGPVSAGAMTLPAEVARFAGVGTLRARWQPVLEPLLAGLDGLVVDLRSGSYAALGRVPGAVTVRVLTEHADGTRTIVSHHNKSHKGRVARLLAGTRSEPSTVDDVLKVLRRNGFRMERQANALDLIIHP